MRFAGRIGIITGLLSSLFMPLAASGASSSVVISEIQTGISASASQEFVELYNPTTTDVTLNGWVLQYKSATSANQTSSWTTKASLTGTIKAHGYYLAAPTGYLSGDINWSAGLSATGGHVRLLDGGSAVVDLVGYGDSANAAEGTPAPAPAAGQSIERLPGRLNDSGGNGTDTDNNFADFIIRATPEPQSTQSGLEIPTTGDDIPVAVTPDVPAPSSDPVYLPVDITELLVDPAAPSTDAADEFIELHNGNDQAVNLQGYTLRTGSNFHDYYVLPDTLLPPQTYLAIYSRDSNLGLTNSGGAAQLLDPTGQVVAQTPDYGQAKTGEAFALIDQASGWQWTLQPTPGGQNVLELPPPAVTAAKTAAKPKAKAAPKAKTASVKATKSSAKTAKAKVVKAKSAKPQSPLAAATASTSGRWLLIGLVALTIGYAIYEFRYDLRNYFYLARRNYFSRRKTGQAASRR